MAIITASFVDRIIRTGPLAKARRRSEAGSSLPNNKARWERFSSWSLVCEEILDTEHSPDWYDGIVAELRRRGFAFDQIDAMRRFAWETAGWLNYDKMLWEWVSLDEKDVELALDWQLREGMISQQQHKTGLAFIKQPRG